MVTEGWSAAEVVLPSIVPIVILSVVSVAEISILVFTTEQTSAHSPQFIAD